MANAIAFDGHAALASTFEWPTARGVFATAGLVKVARQSLPTDPVGTTTVTFQGVQAGTEIRVYLPDGTEAAGVEDCTADPVLTWPVYAAGSPNNSVTIRIIHTAYKIKEFAYTSSVGVVSIPVQQEPDRWYKNPT